MWLDVGPWLESVRAQAVRTAAWALVPLAAACGGEDGGVVASGESGSAESSASSTSDGTTSTSSGDASGESGSSSSDGADASSSSTTEGYGDTLADGCWDFTFSGDYLDAPDWDTFACPSLPIPCADVDVYLTEGDAGPEPEMSPEEIAAADEAARCVLHGLRDGTVGHYRVSWSESGGQYSARTEYFVLDGGVVAVASADEDLSSHAVQAYRPARDPMYFDDCLAATELVPLVRCIAATPALQGVADVPALQAGSCIGAVPQCPDG
jgi:hypothetical protein